MAHGIVKTNAAASAECDALVDLVDIGGAGSVKLLNAADTVLGTAACNNPAFGAASNGVATLDVDPAVTIPITVEGEPAWMAFYNNAGTQVFKGTVGPDSGTYDVTYAAPARTYGVGDTFPVTSCTVTVPTS